MPNGRGLFRGQSNEWERGARRGLAVGLAAGVAAVSVAGLVMCLSAERSATISVIVLARCFTSLSAGLPKGLSTDIVAVPATVNATDISAGIFTLRAPTVLVGSLRRS